MAESTGPTLCLPIKGTRAKSPASFTRIVNMQLMQFDTFNRLCDTIDELTASPVSVTRVNNLSSKLDTVWVSCREVHLDLVSADAEICPRVRAYQKENDFADNETRFLIYSDKLASLLPPNVAMDRVPAPAVLPPALERIRIPAFSGDRKQWPNFRDLFTTMVVDAPGLSAVQKLHYLKTSLTGNALSIISNIDVNADNFNEAWRLVHDHFQDVPALITAQIECLLSLQSVKPGKPSTLETLILQTNECIAALRTLGEPVDQWSSLLLVLTLGRLDEPTRSAWHEKIGKTEAMPRYNQLEVYLKHRLQYLPTLSTDRRVTASQGSSMCHRSSRLSTSHQRATTSTPSLSSHQVSNPTSPEVKRDVQRKCIVCDLTHPLYFCTKFKTLTPSLRFDAVKRSKLCMNCLRLTHPPRMCNASKCRQCGQLHHTLLHSYFNSGDLCCKGNPDRPMEKADRATSPTMASHHGVRHKPLRMSNLLATAWVRIECRGRLLRLRALVDPGSQCSFISERAAQLLRVKRHRVAATVTGVGADTSVKVKHATNVSVLSDAIHVHENIAVETFIVPRLTAYAPAAHCAIDVRSAFSDLLLADPEPFSSHPIDVILGVSVYGAILINGILRRKNMPVAQNTLFGWILFGSDSFAAKPAQTIHCLHAVSNAELHSSLQRFWEIEEIPEVNGWSDAENRCEQYFVDTTYRDQTGRYHVRLPFVQNPPDIGNSYERAKRLFDSSERRLQKNPSMKAEYDDFLEQYFKLGHMSKLPHGSTGLNYYLPHHAVIKSTSSTTKLRVVFNASSPSSNSKSLNDNLMVGPKLQQDFASILLRWRRHQYVCSADVEKMFRQIRVHPDDANFQLILWRTSPSAPLETFRLDTVTYGTSSAPYLALRVLRQLASDEQKSFPEASHILENNVYVDDILFGGSSLSQTQALRDQIIALTRSGALSLRKWTSNCPALLADLPSEHCEVSIEKEFFDEASVKTLGILWSPSLDLFRFQHETDFGSKTWTKRSMLSCIAKLFDPLGWISPVLIQAKILIQQLWLTQLGWDDPPPSETLCEWRRFLHGLKDLGSISIPRWIHTDSTEWFSLHGFSDASEKAFGAVVYVVLPSSQAALLLTSKTKVAPIKRLTVPRLELSAALLLVKLLKWSLDSLQNPTAPAIAWTDSSIVLHWLRKSPAQLKTFVGNRVAQIKATLPELAWRHVPSTDNPADLASRGVLCSDLAKHSLWWNGPTWLTRHPSYWPTQPVNVDIGADPEEKHFVVLSTQVATWDLSDKYSSWYRLLRITALLFKFKRLTLRKASQVVHRDSDGRTAEMFWLRKIQEDCFPSEFVCLRKGSNLPKSSCLRTLDPYLDEHDLIRVGGRLGNALATHEFAHPVILSKHKLLTLLLREIHVQTLHGGMSLMNRVLREKYWVLRARVLLRSIVHHCTTCARQRALLGAQKMAPLPLPRVRPSRPFTNTGIDYAGPFSLTSFVSRGQRTRKCYLALFVCMSTRAIHLEVVDDYTTAAFLSAFDRFRSRRACPAVVYSDNGTNFQGASREISRNFRASLNNPAVARYMTQYEISWHFIPASTPHMGGMWESGVRSVKHHLKRIIGTQTLSILEFITLTCKIEACLNSRPIASLSRDDDDLKYLTPGHFLVGAPLLGPPEQSVIDIDQNRLKRWQLVHQMTEQFWRLWQSDYLHTLQKRHKWQDGQPDFQVNDVVLIETAGLPPTWWSMGRVIAVHRGSDGRVRVCDVRTAKGQLSRGVQKLVLLPVHRDDV